jgi:hypothetical protein
MPQVRNGSGLTNKALIRIGRSTTRRGVLARSARTTLGIVGITVGLSSLSQRSARAGERCCGDDSYCGIWGNACTNADCEHGAGVGMCPDYAFPSGGWFYCCELAPTSWGLFYYQDCCCNQSTCATDGCCGKCGPECHCHPDSSQITTWCLNQNYPHYVCTRVVWWGECP